MSRDHRTPLSYAERQTELRDARLRRQQEALVDQIETVIDTTQEEDSDAKVGSPAQGRPDNSNGGSRKPGANDSQASRPGARTPRRTRRG